MTKNEYLKKLEQKLRVLPESEKSDALEYYDGYISDAEDEAAAIAQLGTPGEVAAIILAQSISDGEKTENASPKESAFSGMKTALIVILSLFAAPVALPIIITLAACALVLVVVLGTFVLTFAVMGASLLLSGAAGILVFPFVIFQDFGFALFLAGFGLISVGFGILFIKLTTLTMRGFPKIPQYVSKKILRRQTHEKSHMD